MESGRARPSRAGAPKRAAAAVAASAPVAVDESARAQAPSTVGSTPRTTQWKAEKGRAEA